MANFLKQLFEEKNIDVETELKIEGQINMTIENVIEFILGLDKNTQKKIKNNFVVIDFKNGDVMHFVNYIAKGMAQAV